MADKIIDGDFVTIDYVGRVKDTGKVFDLTREDVAKKEGINEPDIKYGPVPVIVGANHVLKGLDTELLKLSVGDKKKIEIAPEDGFGERDNKLIKLMPRSVFKRENIRPIPGMPVKIQGAQGVVLTVSGGRIKVDFNHPLAGKTLEYEVEVHKKISKKEDQMKSLFELHLPKVETKDLTIKLNQDTAEIMTPQDPKTRRYINLTEDIIAKDIIKYIKGIKQVKFIDVFE